MIKIVPSLLFYAIAIPLILAIHSLSPTSLAGPGLDIVVYGVSAVATLIFLARSLVKIKSSDKRSYLNVFINVVGTLLILALLHWEWTKQN